MESEKIVLKSVYGKTARQTFHILPCKDPVTGMYPPHVRECYLDDQQQPQMILSEKDKEFVSNGGVLIPAAVPIVVQHNTTFDLSNPLDKARWEAIKNSKLIANNRLQKDEKGNYVIDGEKVSISATTKMAVGKYGLADLYIENPGLVAKSKNDFRRLVAKAFQLVMDDSAAGRVTKCKLLEKDMSHAEPSDVEDYLLTMAQNNPEKIIDLYTGTDTANRLLIIDALDKHVLIKRDNLIIYADNIVLGASVDAAVTFLSRPDSIKVKELILQETYPELQKKPKKGNDSQTSI